jgi:hypothetical protein
MATPHVRALTSLLVALAAACGGASSGGGGASDVGPAITTQPADQAVNAGQTATFSVVATGSPAPTYQWRKNGADVAGATAASYTTPATAVADDGAQFTVRVANRVGSVESAVATLTVRAPPVIDVQPQGQTVTEGQTATFSVTAHGAAPLAYQWRRGGVEIAGATAASFTTPATVQADSGAQFTVVVSSAAGTVTSAAATLTVNPGSMGTAPTITTQPASQTVNAGQTATFTVVATGSPAPTYQWRRNGANVAGATSASYTTPATVAGDSGAVFTVAVSNAAGAVTSNGATLTVRTAPAITTQPANRTVTAGQTATFTVVATGSPAPTYQWQRNGSNVSGATSASYTTPATTTADSGATFRVVVSNAAGSVTSSAATLTVTAGAGQTFVVYRDGVVGAGWDPQVWAACGTNNPNMTSSFAGGTAASFDISCGGNSAGTFGHWNGDFDLTPYDTLSFDIGAASTAGMGSLVVWSNAGTNVAVGAVTAGQWKHVSLTLSQLGLAGKQINQFGWANTSGSAGPHFYVNNVVFSGPPIPTTPPTISALAVAHAEDYTATLTWTTDRPCTGAITYQKSGGTARTAQETTRVTAHTFTLDALDPSSTYAVSVVATDAYGNASSPATVSVTTTAANNTPTVTVTLDPAHTRPISPWIYGINGLAGNADVPPHLTLDRSGGNRLTAYNWENNASNAGSDWYYHSDNLMSSSLVPGQAMVDFITADRAIGAASLITLQMQGYVAADENGNVDMSGGDAGLASRLATRFKKVVFKKSTVSGAGAFTASPPTTDANVYMDEYAWALNQRLSGQGIFAANAALPTFVCLDNEPELWNSTHEEVQGTTPVATAPYIQKTIDLGKALKDQFPDMVIFGPVHYGFGGLYNFQFDGSLGGSHWFTDEYLAQLKAASDAYGKRLLDVYDFHWYSESYGGGTRVVDLDGTDLSAAEVQAIVQSPRSLWDPTFTDSSDWISQVVGGPIQILNRIQQKIDASFPGTKIAVTEYENGGWNHIAGTVAQADNLGIFGAKGVFAATFWPPYGTYDYALAGFRAFRGFDGGSALFGDVSIPATSSDVSKVAVYASRDSAHPGRLVFVAINRSTATQKVAINGQALAGTATTWRMTASSAASQVAAGQHVAPVLVGSAPASGSSLFAVLPALSVTTIAVE